MPQLPPGTQPANLAEAARFTDETQLLAALRRSDETAFTTLLDRYQSPMLRLARLHLPDPSLAEEVVQEAWLGVLEGLDRFKGRSSLKTWIFHILLNCARTRARREGRSIPFSALHDADPDTLQPTVDPDRFLPPGHQWAGRWAAFPPPWDDLDARLLSIETHELIERAIADLPLRQRTVIILRDVEGWTPHEVCGALRLSDTNQRVLLHRARASVRRALELYAQEGLA